MSTNMTLHVTIMIGVIVTLKAHVLGFFAITGHILACLNVKHQQVDVIFKRGKAELARYV